MNPLFGARNGSGIRPGFSRAQKCNEALVCVMNEKIDVLLADSNQWQRDFPNPIWPDRGFSVLLERHAEGLVCSISSKQRDFAEVFSEFDALAFPGSPPHKPWPELSLDQLVWAYIVSQLAAERKGDVSKEALGKEFSKVCNFGVSRLLAEI